MSSNADTASHTTWEYLLDIVFSTYVAWAVGMIGFSLTTMTINETLEKVKGYFWRNFFTELEVSNTDRCYHWLLQWFNQHQDQLNHFTVNTVNYNTESGQATSKFKYEPCDGEHVFKYMGYSINVKRERHQNMTSDHGIKRLETLRFSIFGQKKILLKKMLDDARLHDKAVTESGTTLMMPWYQTWQNFGEPRIFRSSSTVILDEGVFENLQKDLQNFINDHSWYLDRGIPYRRGYLLYGPPGCGKTSLIMALAGEIKFKVCVLSLNNSNMSDEMLIELMGAVPPKSLVLLEDIDAMLADRERTESKNFVEDKKKVTLSGLLNALDGVISSEGRILFMTTNHIDKLDAALIRSGRADIKQHIGPCSDYQLTRMFKRFRPDGTDEDNMRFVKKIREQNKPVVPAYLQEFFLAHRHNELKVLFQHIHDIWQDVKNIKLTE